MSAVILTLTAASGDVSYTYEVLSADITREVNKIPYARVQLLDGSLEDQTFPASDAADFEPGAKISISAGYEGGTDATLFEGVVVRQTIEASRERSLLTVEAKDAVVKLTHGRKSMVFLEQSDDAVIGKLLASAKGTIAATELVHRELVQYNATDWDFIRARAEANGLLLAVEDGKVSAQKLSALSGAEHSLEFGLDELYDVELALDGERQFGELEGVGWDIKKQKPTPPASAKDMKLGPTETVPATIGKALGFTAATLTSPAPLDPKELTAWASGRLQRHRMSMIRGRVSTRGDGSFKLLDSIELTGVGARFTGKSPITGIRHRVDKHVGWRTDLQIGLHPELFATDPKLSAPPADGLLPAISGLQIGVVDAFKADPDKQQRVRVILPAIDPKKGSVWARLASPDAGKDRGYVFRPMKGDEVVVGFINDDPRQAVVLGSLFSSTNAVPADIGEANADNDAKGIVTAKGTTLGFYDGDKAAAFITTPNQNTLLIDDSDDSILISDANGNSIKMDANGITITSAKDLTLDGASGNVTISGKKVDCK